jgi:hypothetical protein
MKVEPGTEWICNQCLSSVRIVVSVADSVVTFRKQEDAKGDLHEMNQGLFVITHKKKED